MTTPVDALLPGALLISAKVTLVLAAAALAQALLHRRLSAAARHLVWTVAVIAMLLLPILSIAVPGWPLPLALGTAASPAPGDAPLAAPVSGVRTSDLDSPALPAAALPPPSSPEPARAEWSGWLIAAYGCGALVMLLHLALQRLRVRRISSDATIVNDAAWSALLAECASLMGVSRAVRLLRGRSHTVPMAFGTTRPAIVLPATADLWSEDRRRAVLLHELAHIARLDCFTQTLAVAARAVYWFHPAAWWIARRLRIERELACDDRVIAAGTEPREYARHLLEIAYSFARHRAPALAVGMAQPHQLEGRMLAALDTARNRRIPGRVTRAVVVLIAAAVLVVLSGATLTTAASAPPEETGAAAPRQTSMVAGPALHPVDWTAAAGRLLKAAAEAFGFSQDGLPGTWQIAPSKTPGAVQLRIFELNSSSGFTVPIDQLVGLTSVQLEGAGGPVQFKMTRDAGAFAFEGIIRSGVGAGTFSFTPNAAFPAELEKRGFARPSAREQYQLARHDVGYAFLDELNKQGYSKPTTAELVRTAEHGVSLTYLREMGALGHRLGSVGPLVTLRDHGVTPDYVRGLAQEGYKGLSADQLRHARDHGISQEYVSGMRQAGYGSLSMEALVNARDHGISVEYVRQLDAEGHRKIPLDQLIKVRDHGVSSEYVRDMRQLGYALSLDELVRVRDHGVSAEYVREMSALGYRNQSADSLVRLRDHGVSTEYVKELKALGYEGLSPDELVTLRDHGVTAERIRNANARAGTRLPIDLLRSLAR